MRNPGKHGLMNKVSVKAQRHKPCVTPAATGLWLPVLVFLLALVVRAVYLYDGRNNPTFYSPVVDSQTYDLIARELAQGWGMSREFFWQQFFYPFFLAIIYFFSHGSIVAAKIVQVLLGAVTCLLIYKLGARLFGRSAGLAAGLLGAFYGPLVFFDAELLAAGWACFWTAVLILLLCRMADDRRLYLCCAAGFCAGLSVLTRPNFIPFLPAAAVWLAAVWIRSRVPPKKVALSLALCVVGFSLAALPVAGANYRLTGRLGFLPATGGLNLYIGNNPDFEAVALRPGAEWSRVVEFPLKEGLHTPKERQRFYYAKTLQYFRTQPLDFLKGLASKTAQVTSSREMPGHIDIYMFRRWSPVLACLVWKLHGFGFPFGFLLPPALLGMFFFRRRLPMPLLLFLVLYPATIILTHVEARYRMPVVVPMCVLAGAALVKIIEIVRQRRWGHLAIVAVFSVAAGYLASAVGPFYAERHIDYDAELHYVLAGSLQGRGRTSEAISSYQAAIKLKPDYFDAYHNLGLLLIEEGKPKEAAQHYDKALAVLGEHAALREGLGLALFEQGSVDAAIEQYNKAINIDPRRASIHDNLGRALFNKNRLFEAHQHFSLALELNPDDPMSHNNMGSFLAAQGQLPQAVQHFETSLSIKPADAQTLTNLASALAALGRFEQANKRFAQALRIAPDDPEIYFNLGLCLHHQGRLSEAINAFSKALALEPRHPGASQALKEMLRSKP